MLYDHQNIFAQILRGDLPCNKVYEDECALAFHDLYPMAPLHVLVIPKCSVVSFSDFIKKSNHSQVGAFFIAIQKVIELLQIESQGYRIISNCGVDGAQTVGHFHIHILGKKKLGPILA